MKYKELVSKYDHVKRVYQAGLLVALTTLALNCFSLAILRLLLLLFILVTAFRSLKITFIVVCTVFLSTIIDLQLKIFMLINISTMIIMITMIT